MMEKKIIMLYIFLIYKNEYELNHRPKINLKEEMVIQLH